MGHAIIKKQKASVPSKEQYSAYIITFFLTVVEERLMEEDQVSQGKWGSFLPTSTSKMLHS